MQPQTNDTSRKKTQPNANDRVAQVVQDWSSSWNYTQSSWHHKWQNWDKLYNSERTEVGYNGISDTFVPMSYRTIEAMVAATSGDKPYIQYTATRPDQNTETEVLNGLFGYYWDLDNWTNKFITFSRGDFKIGGAVMMLHWDIDHPVATNIPLRDWFCDPNATLLTYDQAAFMGHRFLTSIEQLKAQKIVDPETGDLVDRFKNLDQLGNDEQTYSPGDQTQKEYLDTHMGSTLDKNAQKGQVEVICHWTLDEVIYVANRKVVIYQGTNPYKARQEFLGRPNPTGMYPYVFDAWNADESQLYGRSALQPIEKPQELLNDLTNQNIDAATWSLDPIMTLDPKYSDYLNKIQNVPGAVYPFEANSYAAVIKPPIPSNVFNERSNIKNEIREATAIDQILRGSGAQSDTTATEVKAQVASAGRAFDIILSQLESGAYYRFAKLVFQLVQMYVTQPTYFKIIGKEGVDWKTFDPNFFQGDYEPRIKLKATVDGEKQAKMRDLKEFYTAMLGNPLIDQAAMTRLVTKEAFNLDPEEVDQLIVPPEQLAAQQGNEPESDPKEYLNINFKDLQPDEKAQVLEQMGIEPSVAYQGQMEQMAVEQMMPEQQLIAAQAQPQVSTNG